jgi:hypothetical protein
MYALCLFDQIVVVQVTTSLVLFSLDQIMVIFIGLTSFCSDYGGICICMYALCLFDQIVVVQVTTTLVLFSLDQIMVIFIGLTSFCSDYGGIYMLCLIIV